MRFAEFTRPDGSKILYSVPPGIVITIPPKTAAAWTKARIIVAGDPQDVDETVDEVRERFEKADE